MLLYDANRPGPNPVVVRLFVLERGGLHLDVETIDLEGLENRRRPFVETVNARGELPALRIDGGRVLTEITAICSYLDDMATGSRRLFGESAEERAEIQMWVRRIDLGIVYPMVAWWRGTEAAEAAYRGHRIRQPEAMQSNRMLCEQALNQLDADLGGRSAIAGEAITMADILLYGFMATNVASGEIPWVNVPQRPNVATWFEAMAARPASARMLQSFPSRIES